MAMVLFECTDQSDPAGKRSSLGEVSGQRLKDNVRHTVQDRRIKDKMFIFSSLSRNVPGVVGWINNGALFYAILLIRK